MLREILNITLKELLQLLRDRRMFPLILIAPTLQLIIYGYAATFDIENIPTAVYDLDRSAESREYLRRFFNSRYFKATLYVDAYDDVRSALDAGKVTAAIVIPPDFARDLHRGRTAKVQMFIDGTNSNEATLAANYAAGISQRHALDSLYTWLRIVGDARLLHAAEHTAEGVLLVDDRIRVRYNPSLQSRNFMVPGVIALILLIMTSIMTSMSMVREKEIGTMEQLIVTPVRSVNLILGKLIPFVFIGVLDVTIILLAAVFWFDIPIRGSIPLLFALSGLFLLSTLSLGLLVSTFCRTQQQAMIVTFFFIMPMILLSGFIFPIANMPVWIQYLTYLMPVRYFLIIIRGIVLKGVGAGILWPQIYPLVIFGLFMIAMCILRFRKRIM
ncbi:MAG: ABC transporter permease [Candidatus Abyssobacteria bacterium SURF_5]|uniref:ABC transporter permease n=1 Tax=Abyssobacteria bacterium (strain SURF_5) TaxID=2093360 RepID=A0A3A4NSC4_ABYX5|nr:MAG: ABC transporter permease [Candidatus Abyssubacteria bacterium SURF_5]